MSDATKTNPTASVARLSRGDKQGAQIALVWVFPEQKITPLPEHRLTIGRGKDCGLTLSGEQISRQHAEIERDGPIYVLRDLNSKNGTFHNGQRVTETVLEAQDVIRTGDWVGVLANVGKDHQGIEQLESGEITGATLRGVYEQAHRAAGSSLPIVISGETGTGKEVLAKLIHRSSQRSGEFVAVNCAALPETLAEAELFGHQKGAFTGADRARPGLFRQADRGTLLLDEVQELSLEAQAKLLRILQEGLVTPLGESRSIAVDVRVVAAGQSSLEDAVAQGKFRGDLFARLNGLELRLPHLRERREEIVPIFLKTLKDELRAGTPRVDTALIERLCAYDWPFNIRELIQVARQIAVLHGHEPPFTEEHLPDRIRREKSPVPAKSAQVLQTAVRNRRSQADATNDRQLDRLVAALREHSGNVSKAASALGISRQRAYRLMDLRPDLDVSGVRHPSEH